MNVGSCYLPPPHREWGQCAEELLFYTSRYSVHTQSCLVRLSGNSKVSLAGYQAEKLDPRQKFCMARLLSRPPSEAFAGAIIQLVEEVAGGGKSVPTGVLDLLGNNQPIPYFRTLVSRPRQSSGLEQVSAEELIRHLASRYHFPLRLRGRVIWLDSERIDQLLHSRRAQIRRNMIEALRYLNRSGYLVHLRLMKCAKAA